jgi:glycosyltransferase involved in cell wall biosynthesis
VPDGPGPPNRRLKLLVSAYACEPGQGSEPGLGWKMPREMAQRHDVWVITRSNNRHAIELELAQRPVSNLHFHYFDLPHWARWWKRRQRGVQLYYYFWQVGAYLVARRLCHSVRFDIVQHVTFVKYWAPSFMALLPMPFIWGPVGGGESAPRAFLRDFGWRGRMYELIRAVARALGEYDPFVRLSARRSALALATTEQTAERLRTLGASDVRVFSESGISDMELEELSQYRKTEVQPVRFISIGRLLHWKGFHLGIRAFARLDGLGAEYWILGDGPERRRLEALAEELGIADRVRFWGNVPRLEAFRRLGQCTALIHPSLHDSGGMVCLEAMASGRPVVCLDLGGPSMQVTEQSGFKVPALDPDQAIRDIAAAMSSLARDPDRRARMGIAARSRVNEHFIWSSKRARLDAYYGDVVSPDRRHPAT